jgi:hypothetical protein
VTSEPFLTRWSRLKRETPEKETAAPDRAAEPAPAEASEPAAPAAAAGEKQASAVDLEALPSIDSLTAESDIAVFLREGVPAELRKAALRRAWTADPAIRDFIGIAENQWDFTDPGAIPGFGPMAPGETTGELVAAALGHVQPSLTAELSPGRTAVPAPAEVTNIPPQVPGIPERTQHLDERDTPVEEQQNETLAAAQHTEARADLTRPRSRRTHGGALPK